MHECDNCRVEFDTSNEGVVATAKGVHVAAVCGNCLKGAKVVKLVLRKGDIGGFSYEQYSAIEMEKTPRAKAAG